METMKMRQQRSSQRFQGFLLMGLACLLFEVVLDLTAEDAALMFGFVDPLAF